MTRPQRPERSGGLSLTTLLLASLSSATAALLGSRLWEDGTVVSAAVTPIVVALVSEALRRPTERLGEAARPRSRERPAAAEEVPRFGDEGPPPRLYGGRRVRLQSVLITAVLAFVIAAAALTLPELLLGSSVSGGGERTTYFGGKAAPRAESESEQSPADEGEQQTTSTTTTETAPETETAPPEATTPTTPAEPPATPAPTQPAPEGGQPAPPAPAPSK